MLVACPAAQGCLAQARVAPRATKLHTHKRARGVAARVAAPTAPGDGLLAPDFSKYPPVDLDLPGVEVSCVHLEPPVFVVHKFLSPLECGALIAAARGGQLREIEYDNAMLLDTTRLWPLALVAGLGAGFDAWQQLGGAAEAASAAVDPAAVAAVGVAALAKWGVLIAAVVGSIQLALPRVLGKVFTGTKWTTGGAAALDADAAAALQRFVSQVTRMAVAEPSRLEVPTVTRYQQGQYQRAHYDGRPAGDPQGLREFMAAGGQRLMQVIVYLNTLTPEQQGGTKFLNPLLGGVTVQPRTGDALVFFPAFKDGELDGRMLHAGLEVKGKGSEKWILGTWVCQFSPPRD